MNAMMGQPRFCLFTTLPDYTSAELEYSCHALSQHEGRVIVCAGRSRPEIVFHMRAVKCKHSLVDLLLLVDGELSRTHVDQQKQTSTGSLLAQ
jgi:hypothetical protein